MTKRTRSIDATALIKHIDESFEQHVIPSLSDFIKIPNVSPLFDPTWATNGLERKAAEHLVTWAKTQQVQGMVVELHQLPGCTSLITVDIPAFESNNASCVLAYAHFDKQPPLDGEWAEGLGPYTPVIRDGKLYGRGGGDDGYGIYAAITAVLGLQKQGIPHSRVFMIVEGSEESGSMHLPQYVEHFKDRIGTPDLCLCLDSGCENYDQLWVSSSLRGLVAGTLSVSLLTAGVHSGNSGLVASSFRVLRRILDRLENAETGEVIADGFSNGIPEHHVAAAKQVGAVLGDEVWTCLPTKPGVQPVSTDNAELLLNKTWRPQLCVTGVDGMPTLTDAGNVLRSHTSVKLSLRLPPNVDGPTAAATLKELLEKDPMYGAKVEFTVDKAASGWHAPESAAWLSNALEESSMAFFQQPVAYCGIGGSIPFIGKLAKQFPTTQFCVTGVLGPGSNAHGPDEMISIPFTKKLTASIAMVLGSQCTAAESN